MANWGNILLVTLILTVATGLKNSWGIAFRVLGVGMCLFEVHVRMEKIFTVDWGFAVFDFDPFVIFAKIENIFD